MNKTKKSKNYITIIKYPYNEYLQTIITIRIQLGWVKREEGCEMPDQHKTKPIELSFT